MLSPELVRIGEVSDQTVTDGIRQLAGPQGIEVKWRDHRDGLIVVQRAEQARLLVPIVLDHPAHDGCGATAPHGTLGLHPQRFGYDRQRTHLYAEIGVQVGRLDWHAVIPQRAVVQARRVRVVVLRQTIGVVVVHAEPPGVPAHQRHIDLLQKVQVGVGLVQLERGPGHDGRLGDLGAERVVNIGDDSFVVDGIGDHAVGQLAGEHSTQLVPSQHGVHVAEGQGVEASIPVPDTYVLDLGRHHGLMGHMAQRLHQVAAHHPPSVIVLVSIGFGHRRHAGEPILPASLGSGQRLGERGRLAVQLQVAADVEVDGHVVATFHDKFDQVGLPFQT